MPLVRNASTRLCLLVSSRSMLMTTTALANETEPRRGPTRRDDRVRCCEADGGYHVPEAVKMEQLLALAKRYQDATEMAGKSSRTMRRCSLARFAEYASSAIDLAWSDV